MAKGAIATKKAPIDPASKRRMRASYLPRSRRRDIASSTLIERIHPRAVRGGGQRGDEAGGLEHAARRRVDPALPALHLVVLVHPRRAHGRVAIAESRG